MKYSVRINKRIRNIRVYRINKRITGNVNIITKLFIRLLTGGKKEETIKV